MLVIDCSSNTREEDVLDSASSPEERKWGSMYEIRIMITIGENSSNRNEWSIKVP